MVAILQAGTQSEAQPGLKEWGLLLWEPMLRQSSWFYFDLQLPELLSVYVYCREHIFCLLAVALEVGLPQHILCQLLTTWRVWWAPGTVWIQFATLRVKVRQSTRAGVICKDFQDLTRGSHPLQHYRILSLASGCIFTRGGLKFVWSSAVSTYSFPSDALPTVIWIFYIFLCKQ